MYEVAHKKETSATELGVELGLDAGYLSRILRSFQKGDLIERRPSKTDGRQILLRLTARGQKAFAKLTSDSGNEVQVMLQGLPEESQSRLVGAMGTIEELLHTETESKTPYLLRPHRPGDMGWVVQRHGELYALEYGWDEGFEALVAEIVARFIRQFDPKRERCWIAEKAGRNVGSVFLVKKSNMVAQLRLLLVEPQARGLGIGARLVDECTRFARQVRYRKIILWTNSVLHAARHIYENAGYRRMKEEPHHSFGQDLVGQTWELKL